MKSKMPPTCDAMPTKAAAVMRAVWLWLLSCGTKRRQG